MKHTQNASDVQCSSQKTQTIGEGKNAAENDVQSCSQLKPGSEPAFPGMTYISQDGKKNPEGMTIRDYFAAAIMQGLMASQYQVDDPYAIYAYKIADAMIRAREAKP